MSQRVLVTGISGFIAKHIALKLLQSGHAVTGTVRSLNKTDQIETSLSSAGADITNLEFALADLNADEGWEDAAKGCDSVIHVASPLPIAQPRDRNALTSTARDGALRVLRAGQKTDRIIITSSIAAMMYRAGRPPVTAVNESDWTDVSWKALSAYIVSKTEAEKSVWALAADEGFKHRLTTINPGLVLGPVFDDDISASLEIIRLFLTGAYPAVPPASYPIVDVRDVADLHIKALTTPDVGGRRLIAAADTLSLKEIAALLIEAFPERAKKIPTRELPAMLVRIAAKFDRNLASVVPDLGSVPQANTSYVKAMTGIEFRSGREAALAAARSLEKIKTF